MFVTLGRSVFRQLGRSRGTRKGAQANSASKAEGLGEAGLPGTLWACLRQAEAGLPHIAAVRRGHEPIQGTR